MVNLLLPSQQHMSKSLRISSTLRHIKKSMCVKQSRAFKFATKKLRFYPRMIWLNFMTRIKIMMISFLKHHNGSKLLWECIRMMLEWSKKSSPVMKSISDLFRDWIQAVSRWTRNSRRNLKSSTDFKHNSQGLLLMSKTTMTADKLKALATKSKTSGLPNINRVTIASNSLLKRSR